MISRDEILRLAGNLYQLLDAHNLGAYVGSGDDLADVCLDGDFDLVKIVEVFAEQVRHADQPDVGLPK